LVQLGGVCCSFVPKMMIRTLYRQFQNERILNAYREKNIKRKENNRLLNERTNFAERMNKLFRAEEQTLLNGRTNFTQRENELFCTEKRIFPLNKL
jgi:hypothetical protein